MSPDPYATKALDTKYPCADKSLVIGKFCCILHARAENRGLNLTQAPSRAVLKNEVHELILTAEENAVPGQVVNNISYLGYFEILESGIIWVGDKVYVNDQLIGALAGYDLTHFPNHMNIIVKIDKALYTGKEIGLKPGDPITFVFPGRPEEE
jgi:hypothetical protein